MFQVLVRYTYFTLIAFFHVSLYSNKKNYISSYFNVIFVICYFSDYLKCINATRLNIITYFFNYFVIFKSQNFVYKSSEINNRISSNLLNRNISEKFEKNLRTLGTEKRGGKIVSRRRRSENLIHRFFLEDKRRIVFARLENNYLLLFATLKSKVLKTKGLCRTAYHQVES